MYKNNYLARSVHIALISGVAASVLSVPAVFAAEAEEKAAKVERISVTGSRIKRSDMETASPVTVIDASAIQALGSASIDGVLQQLTASGGGMTSATTNNGGRGNATVNLRGLGEERTLVLVNGRRMIPSGTGATSTVDLNTIPVSMVERIEVLKDGASATYGSDAIAGVVNIILKRDFEGFQFNAQTGMTEHGDGDETIIDATIGNSFDKGNLVMNIQYTKRGETGQADRGFSSCPYGEADGGTSLYCGGSATSLGGHIRGDKNFQINKSGVDKFGKPTYQAGDAGFYGYYYDDTDGNLQYAYNDDSATPANLSGRGGTYHNYIDSGEGNDRFNYNEYSYLYTPLERINLTTSGTYELFDSVTFFAEAMYSKRWTNQQMAPEPVGVEFAYNPIGGNGIDIDIDGTNSYHQAGWMSADFGDLVQTGEMVDYSRRLLESGTRNFSQSVDTIRIVAGLEGEFDNGWTWDFALNKGRNDATSTTENLHNMTAITNDIISGSFDPVKQTSWSGANLAEYNYTAVEKTYTEMDIYSANLSGDIMELPAGELAFATGVSHRKESAGKTPDPITAQGLGSDDREEATSGSYTVKAAYVELAVPLLSDLPLAEQVDLSAAIRYFDYNTFGDDNTWKLGLTWKVNDSIMLRGVRSTAFRAPSVDELYGGAGNSYSFISHAASSFSQAQVTVGGSADLKPEEANITTLGVVLQPSFLENFSATVDYFDIDITNAITELDADYIANLCVSDSGQLQNTNDVVCQDAGVRVGTDTRIIFDNRLRNVGGESTTGFDINMAYTFEGLGLDWRINSDTTIITSYETTDQNGTVTDYAGKITSSSDIGGYAKYKSNLDLRTAGDDWSATYQIRYIDGMESMSGACDTGCYGAETDAVFYHNLSGTYILNETVSFGAGVNNLFDQEPEYYTGYNSANTSPGIYDVLGRYYYLRGTVRF
ncbi:TonB-dependent receptor domain-containing protein [Shewanella surugensis]|uniref:TonB-dependent receptor n=1 Tax=Shewanella surugensis TaxID=212020 RepID=A0ABT0L963_9GAMM|nr:TonB-dependent receptor [Shewanella surugensis]MCL1123910.1 TonB-dependent receptor [Shewanella surugensis]